MIETPPFAFQSGRLPAPRGAVQKGYSTFLFPGNPPHRTRASSSGASSGTRAESASGGKSGIPATSARSADSETAAALGGRLAEMARRAPARASIRAAVRVRLGATVPRHALPVAAQMRGSTGALVRGGGGRRNRRRGGRVAGPQETVTRAHGYRSHPWLGFGLRTQVLA